MKFSAVRKVLFIILLLFAAGLIVGFDDAQGAEDLVVAVDKSTLVKALGVIFLGIFTEIWRNQRGIYRRLEALGTELKELKGFCKGKNSDCGEDN